jgi:hypothetical protein
MIQQNSKTLTISVQGKRLTDMTFFSADLERLGDTALQEFAARIRTETSSSSSSAESPLRSSAERLEAKLEQLYGIAVTLTQRQEALSEVAAVWAHMVAVCDRIAKALAADPSARSLESYDRILDIRNACEENRALHA